MIGKPIARISRFTGMSDQGGMFNIDGFSIEKEQGLTSIDENYLASSVVTSATAGYSGMGNIKAIKYLYPLTGSNISASDGYTIMLDNTCYLYSYYYITNAMYNGRIGGTPTASPYLYCQNPDLFLLPSGNLIYTSSQHLSLIVRGLCKSGSSTTKIVDKDGRNFTALGLSASSPNNKVTNLLTGVEYTITSITTTTSTNDTLNFTAVGTNNNAENDEFIGIVLTKWDLNTGITIPTFNGQPQQAYWSRPIKQWGNQYMVLNGNYIALLANDESTIDQTYKQLPVGYQGLTMEINSGYILVSAYDNNGNSHLLYWDGLTDGWNEDTIIDVAPKSIKAYKRGFVCVSDGVLYYSDGVNIKKLIAVNGTNDLNRGVNTGFNNGIIVVKDKIYFTSTGNNSQRAKDGVFIFDVNSGLSFFKCKDVNKGFAIPESLALKTSTNISNIYSTSCDIEIGCGGVLCNLNEYQASSSTRDYKSFIYMLDFGQETQIKEVWLNMKMSTKRHNYNNQLNTDITIAYGNDDYPIYSYIQSSQNTTNYIYNPVGSQYPGKVGAEIEFLTGDCAGERTFIESIQNPGTNSEILVVSPLLSTVYNYNSQLNMINVKKGEQKKVSVRDLNKPIRFNVNFFGSKMYLEVVVRGTTNPFPVSINDILLF